MVAIGPSSQQSHSTQHTYTTHSLLHSSLTTCSVIVSVPLLPQIRVGSSHLISVHIILDDPAGNSYIQVAALHLHSLTTTFFPRTKYVATFSVHPHLSPTPLIQHPSLLHVPLTTTHWPPSPQQNIYALKEDPELKVEFYTRSPEQNELLGLDQMNMDWSLHQQGTTSWLSIYI